MIRLLRALARRHNDVARANARARLAQWGAALDGVPGDEIQPCAACVVDAAAVDALTDDELAALARALGVYVDRAEITADFDMWTEEMA